MWLGGVERARARARAVVQERGHKGKDHACHPTHTRHEKGDEVGRCVEADLEKGHADALDEAAHADHQCKCDSGYHAVERQRAEQACEGDGNDDRARGDAKQYVPERGWQSSTSGGWLGCWVTPRSRVRVRVRMRVRVRVRVRVEGEGEGAGEG
jgi:hypothetical protein